MTKEALYQRIADYPVILDGATGSNLQKAGMPTGVCPENWILENEDILVELQKAFVEAGTEILYAPTFSSNRVKLAEYGLADRTEEINKRLVEISRKAAGERALVAGDMTMTGVTLAPIGPMQLEDLIDIYKEQAKYLYEAGVDLFVVETMMSLAETRAAVIAIKETCDLPVIASMTFQEDGRTLYGTDPVTAVVVLQSIGADIIGVNCSTGPEQMLPTVRLMKEYADVPLLVKPNAGLPVLVEGETIYPMEAEEFASFGPGFVEAGVGLLRGGSGTTPEHIRRWADSVRGRCTRQPQNVHPSMLASERKSQEITLDGNFLIIGERINPTGKKKLQAELRAGKLHIVEEMAEQQEEMGAHILDINMGTNGIDEKQMMLRAIEKVTMVSSLPLCIDTSYVEVMEAALRAYPGRALVNSISMEKEKIDRLLPLVKKYGAMFILLPLSDKGLPESLEEKKQLIHGVLAKADALGIDRSRIIVDGLVTTVGANKTAALETLETIRYCKEDLGLCTTIGLSNISFGLPERAYVNGAFAAMAIQSGLTMAIANPANSLLMGIAFASDLLQNKNQADIHYIEQVKRIGPVSQSVQPKTENPGVNVPGSSGNGVSGNQMTDAPGNTVSGKGQDSRMPSEGKSGTDLTKSPVFEAVLKGNTDEIAERVKVTLDEGISPKMILDGILIPAINEVGRLFNIQAYFLPQLIASANAMKAGIDYLEPYLQEGNSEKEKPVIVIATVEGDIHDIGKNLVALMFKNYGYQVCDLGKDVPASMIIDAAREHEASIICLSALMTTTMMKMKETVLLRNEENLKAKVIIGGAVTTPSFAEEIGADGYSKDASDAVKLVQRLLEENE
ncbi:MAG: homocysteine S-methyltransferase family protein [Clostridiales bacterium]|nr:homocysteine S-methyltransferase family protein [Clostridiales bacterium]